MTDKKLMRFGSISLLLSGLFIAVFWLLVIPLDSFAGVENSTNPTGLIGQWFHLFGPILAVFGLTALYLYHRESTGWLGFLAFILGVVGSIGIAIDGAVGLVIAPAMAAAVPATVAADGILFTGAILTMYIVVSVVNMIGLILTGIAVWFDRTLPLPAAMLFILGAILNNLPPIPGMFFILIIGGVVWGIGAGWLGISLMQKAT